MNAEFGITALRVAAKVEPVWNGVGTAVLLLTTLAQGAEEIVPHAANIKNAHDILQGTADAFINQGLPVSVFMLAWWIGFQMAFTSISKPDNVLLPSGKKLFANTLWAAALYASNNAF